MKTPIEDINTVDWREYSVEWFWVQLLNYFTRKNKDVIAICRCHHTLYFCLRWLIKSEVCPWENPH